MKRSAPEAGQKPRLTFSDVPIRDCFCDTKHLTRTAVVYYVETYFGFWISLGFPAY